MNHGAPRIQRQREECACRSQVEGRLPVWVGEFSPYSEMADRHEAPFLRCESGENAPLQARGRTGELAIGAPRTCPCRTILCAARFSLVSSVRTAVIRWVPQRPWSCLVAYFCPAWC